MVQRILSNILYLHAPDIRDPFTDGVFAIYFISVK